MIADSRPETRPEPGRNKALALTLLMHALLVAVLFLGVQWKRSAPEVVEVELWTPRPSQPAPPPEPTPPPPEPKPIPPEPVKPPPPKPVEVKKPDIVEKTPEKKPEKKPPEPPKPPPPKPPQEVKPPPKPVPEWQKQLDQELTTTRAETARVAAVKAAENESRSAAAKKGKEAWSEKIRQKIRGNTVALPNIQGNPVVVFSVTQLPTGEILDVRVRTPSSNRAYDESIERAIRNSSPLPPPSDSQLFERELILTFCPNPDESGKCR